MLNINTLFLLVVMIETQTNLICNGDFQAYETTILYNGSLNNTEYSGYVQTNASCWIRHSLAMAGAFTTSIQVKLISIPAWPVTTKVIDTVSYDKYGICQNLTLNKTSKYTLKYNLILDASIINTTIGTYVNSVSILSKIYNKQYTVYTQTINFTANATSNLICLQPDLINYNSSFNNMFPSFGYGPIIDNISLYLSSQLINSTTNSTINSTTNSTNLTSNQTGNSTGNSTINSNSSTFIISNSTTNSTQNSSTNSANSTTLISNSTTTSNNQNFNSSNFTTNFTSASNYTTNISNQTNSSTIIQNSTTNFSNNQSSLNITSNSTVNVTSNTTQNLTSNSSENSTLGSSSLNTTLNTTSINNSESNISTIIPNITIPYIQQNRTVTQIVAHFKSTISSLSENIVMVSDLKPSKYGISLYAFSILRVQIQQTPQNNFIYYTDKDGYLCIQFLPESYYDQNILSHTLKIYLPYIPFDVLAYNFTVIVDGKSINVVILKESQKNIMEETISTMQAISKMIQKSFLVINSVSCSYFLISLLGFYNLSLMYIFLKLKTLPNFTRIFLNTLAYVFFSKGSVTGFIKDTLKIQQQINWFDFPITEKMESHKEQFIWFGVFGNSSNFMLNNFESLVLLGFLLVKFTLLKIIIKVLPEKLKQQLDVKPSKFYQHFLGQLSCFVPFFVVSSTKCLIEMGERNWDGQLNNLIQIFVFFLFSIATIIGFCVVCQKENRKLLKLNKLKTIMKIQKWIADTSKHKRKKSNALQKYSYYLLCFLIPFTVIIGSNLMFFILVSPIIVWRFYCSIISIHRKKSFKNIFKLMNKIVWIIYQFAFLLLYILQLLKIDANKNMLNFIKYIGFVLIFCVLIGASIDILQAVILIIISLVKFIKICLKNCQNKVSPCSQRSEKKIYIKQDVQKRQKVRQKEKRQKNIKKKCRKLKIEQIYNLQKQKNPASLALQQKIKKVKTTKIKNASTNRQITNKKLKIEDLD